MDQEVWQQLLSLESQEVVKKMFKTIHGNDLNTRRANEINSAARQAREYFRNVSNSSFSVRPLLAFYGVSSLTRSLALLVKKNGGEESLTAGHGLNTVDWSTQLSGEINITIKNLSNLKVKSSSGLFMDFLRATENIMCFHVNSSAVDWKMNYSIPQDETTFNFGNLLARLPDLQHDFQRLPGVDLYTPINKMTFSNEKGFECKVRTKQLEPLKEWYIDNGYQITGDTEWSLVITDGENFNKNTPQFIHSYVQKTFGSIPSLYLSTPFDDKKCFSQLAQTFLASYYLGMLVRYYPTHWTQLVNGGIGDNYWPILNRLQIYIEKAFPELVIELINDMTKVST